MGLTRRQSEILNFIRDYSASRGYAPTLEEIGGHFGLSSVATVHKHVANLVAKGYLKRGRKNASRDLSVLPSPEAGEALCRIPLLGIVAAGRPIEALPTSEDIALPESWLGRRQTYALRVQGDSMIEEQIRDGDVVVVEEREVARDGETVVALVDGQNVTVKRYRRRASTVYLEPANPALSPLALPEERVRIQGVVIGVLRRY